MQADLDVLIANLKQGQRAALAKAITLVESRSPRHAILAESLLEQTADADSALTIGISGYPGAGKSTLIEAFGLYLIGLGHKVAVLAVDPSSHVNKGSILGDKTRMTFLSRHPDAYVRPSPSGGILGGVTQRTRETIQLCDAAGYDVVIVETVGVGQNEVSVKDMVDFYMLLLIPAAGDELQGIKKGVIEMADAVFINKADLFPKRARLTSQEYKAALSLSHHPLTHWKTPVEMVSALNPKDIALLWDKIQAFLKIAKAENYRENLKAGQNRVWLKERLKESILNQFFNNLENQAKLESALVLMNQGRLSISEAIEAVIESPLT